MRDSIYTGLFTNKSLDTHRHQESTYESQQWWYYSCCNACWDPPTHGTQHALQH